MIGPAWASNPDLPITVARQHVLQRYQQHQWGTLVFRRIYVLHSKSVSCHFFSRWYSRHPYLSSVGLLAPRLKSKWVHVPYDQRNGQHVQLKSGVPFPRFMKLLRRGAAYSQVRLTVQKQVIWSRILVRVCYLFFSNRTGWENLWAGEMPADYKLRMYKCCTTESNITFLMTVQ